MVIQYHTATIKPDKDALQQLRNKGFKTDVMMCIMPAFIGHGKSQEETMVFLQEADNAGAAPSISFETTEGEALNIRSREETPMLNILIQLYGKTIWD